MQAENLQFSSERNMKLPPDNFWELQIIVIYVSSKQFLVGFNCKLEQISQI